VIAAVVVVGGALALTRVSGFASRTTPVPTFQVPRGPLTISVIESGTIKSQDQVILKNEVEGQTTLIFLIPEGTEVEEGQLLAELDASQLQDGRVEQQIRVDNAEAAFVRARESLAVAKNQAESDISKAELDYQFAQEDLKRYLEGEYPQAQREAESKITIAGEESKRAKEKLDWSERLFEEKYISQTELEADRLTYRRAELEYELAVAARELLENYTHQRQLAQLGSDVDQMRMALERTRLQANADIVQAEADHKAKEAEFQQQQNKLAKLEGQILKTKIVAPRDGLVVYATSTRSSRFREQPLEEGQAVRERQELIYLPSTEAAMAELMVHESSLEKVQVGQLVRVTVDAMPGRSFTGRVKSIAPLPDAQSTWLNPDRKVYATKVFLDGNTPDLRTGMSCRAEILVQQLSDVVYVPVQAVVRVGGKPNVYIQSGGTFVPHEVTTGLDNSSMVHVASGLNGGEVVSLTPPLDVGTTAFAAVMPTDTSGDTAPPQTAAPTPGAAAEPERRAAAADAPDEDRAARRARFQNMSDEERAAEWRKRMESMTPEQREEATRRMRDRQSRQEAGGEEATDGRAGRSTERGSGREAGAAEGAPRDPAEQAGKSP